MEAEKGKKFNPKVEKSVHVYLLLISTHTCYLFQELIKIN
jgi:hypothetical protein